MNAGNNYLKEGVVRAAVPSFSSAVNTKIAEAVANTFSDTPRGRGGFAGNTDLESENTSKQSTTMRPTELSKKRLHLTTKLLSNRVSQPLQSPSPYLEADESLGFLSPKTTNGRKKESQTLAHH